MKTDKVIIVLTLIVFFLNSGCSNRVTNENLEDIEKIKIGMHFNQVEKIMRNSPFEQDEYDFEPDEFISLYDSPVSSAGDFSITYSKNDSIVKRIYKGD